MRSHSGSQQTRPKISWPTGQQDQATPCSPGCGRRICCRFTWRNILVGAVASIHVGRSRLSGPLPYFPFGSLLHTNGIKQGPKMAPESKNEVDGKLQLKLIESFRAYLLEWTTETRASAGYSTLFYRFLPLGWGSRASQYEPTTETPQGILKKRCPHWNSTISLIPWSFLKMKNIF